MFKMNCHKTSSKNKKKEWNYLVAIICASSCIILFTVGTCLSCVDELLTKKTAVTDSVCNISFCFCFFAGSQRKAWLSATNRIFWYQVSYVFPQHRLGSGKNNYFCLYIFKRNTFCSFFLTCSNRISSSNQEVFQFGKCKTIFISLGDVR